MNSLQIKQFFTILKYMNITKAAEELYITQSALSQSLSRMEKELNIRLFYRDNNRLILSSKGEELLPYLKVLENAWEQVMSKAIELSKIQGDCVTVGCSGSILWFSTFFMSNFFDNYKDNSVETVFSSIAMIEKLLLTKQVDMAIVTSPLLNDDINGVKVLDDRIYLAVPMKHPLAARDSVSIADIEEYEFIGLTRQHSFRNFCDRVFEAHDVTLRYAFASSYSKLYPYIELNQTTGDYLALCPESCFDKTYGTCYKKVLFEERDMTFSFYIIWLKEQRIQQKYAELIQYITDNFHSQLDFYSEYTNYISSQFQQAIHDRRPRPDAP